MQGVLPPSDRGRLIAFEGGEACGKSTQAALLAEALGAVLTREPGGTPAGERIRDVLLDPAAGELGAEAELLLMAAARAEHVRQVVAPALSAGRTVVTDRYSGSSLAYQGYGRGLDLALVARISDVATGGIEPDLNVLLVLPEDVAEARRGGSPDRIESADEAFHARVSKGFGLIAAADPEHWVVVDGVGSQAAVAARVGEAVAGRLGALGSVS